jgi:hypothetical protein
VILNPPLDHLAMVSFKPSVLREIDAAADIQAGEILQLKRSAKSIDGKEVD